MHTDQQNTMSNAIVLAAMGVGALATLLQVIGLAIPYWTVVEDFMHAGLWQTCGIARGATICVSYPTDFLTGSIMAARALSILAVLVMVAVLGLAALKAFVKKEANALILGTAILSFLGGVFAAAGAGAYAAENSTGLGAGFALCIVAGILCLITGGLLMAAKMQQS